MEHSIMWELYILFPDGTIQSVGFYQSELDALEDMTVDMYIERVIR